MRISDWSSDVCSSDLQTCSAASLVILVGSAVRSPRLLRQLVDAVRSVRTGWPSSLGTTMGPLIERSEERRVVKVCVCTCRSRESLYNYKNNNHSTPELIPRHKTPYINQ